MAKRSSTTPSHLSTAAQQLWTRLRREYELDDAAAEVLLLSALEARDRAAEARERIDKEGLTVEDRFGQAKPHPLLAVERDSKSTMHAALRQLHLGPESVA